MTDHDDEVFAFLRERARRDDAVAPVALDEVTHRTVPRAARIARPPTDRRHAALAAAVVVALVAGSLVGFAAGRSSAPKQRATVATRDQGATAPEPAKGTASTVVGSFAGASASVGGAGAGFTLTPVFKRTTADGVAIRAYLQPEVAVPMPAPMPACPPNADCAVVSNGCPPQGGCVTGSAAVCSPTSFLMLEVSTDEAVTQGGAPAYDVSGVVGVVRSVQQFGEPEGAAATFVAVQVADGVKDVRAVWPDGTADDMAPVNGWAVLAARRTDTPVVHATNADGDHIIDSSSISGGLPPECTPNVGPPPTTVPPELPPPGEQPADVQSATDQVHTAYQVVFSHDTDPASRRPYIEDVDALQPAFDQLNKNFPEATQTVTVDIGDIVFTSPTTAALYFTLNYTGGALFGQQIGHATLIDGTWKVSRDTMCMVLGWAGATCPASGSSGTGSAPSAPPTTAAN